MVLINFVAEEWRIGVGVGGAFFALGAGFLVNSFLNGPEVRQGAPADAQAATPPDQPDGT